MFGSDSLQLQTLGDDQAMTYFSRNASGAVFVQQRLDTQTSDVFYVSKQYIHWSFYTFQHADILFTPMMPITFEIIVAMGEFSQDEQFLHL